MKQKHILVVSQYFYPESFRINDICKEWIKRGYKVTVLTGIPNYPEGKFYKGYNWFKRKKETWNGIDIIRIPLIARGKSSFKLVLNYFSFVYFGFFWKMFTRRKADLVFTFEVSPMTQALIGVWYAKKRKIPHFLYVQDLWPENVEVVTGIRSRMVIGPITKMTKSIYKRSDLILATSESFVTAIQERIPNQIDKVKYWSQYAEDFYRPVDKIASEIPQDGIFKVIFTGNIGQAQGLDILPKAAKILQDEGIKVQFVIVGDGRDRERFVLDIKKNEVSDMFLLIPRQEAERIPTFLHSCQAAFISFKDSPLFANTIPAKLQSYMACGMPIIAAASGETERIIREANCGVCSKIGDAQDVAMNIKSLMQRTDLKELSNNGRQYYCNQFDKEKLMDQMDIFIEEAALFKQKNSQKR